MSRPAFRTTYYQNYPPPFYPGMTGQWPVPGWGVRPVMAGPERVGVGAVAAANTSGGVLKQMARPRMIAARLPEDQSLEKPFPWVWIFTAAGLLGGGLALAYNYKLLGKKR